MFKMMTRRSGLMTLLAIAYFYAGSLAAQDQSVLDTPIADPNLNQPGNMALKIPTEDIEAPVPPGQESQDASPQTADEIVEQMTRGPLHEAFAEVQLDEPVPSSMIRKKPPEPINELPPQYKPDGENIEWIPGYWAWDEEREDYFWISGIWRDIPPGQRWVPGYWEPLEDGFRWVNGFWMDAKVEEIEYLPPPPASLENGPSTPAPTEQHFYSPGTWIYQTNDYVWQPGCWMPRVSEWVWVPACYIWTPRGCVFRPGYWDRLFDCRGLVFAPICYRRPVYVNVGYYYTPSCVINTNFDLLPHLFVRRNCRSYYFGDWYDRRYIDNDFCAWSQITARPRYRNCYDPFFTYYNYSSIQYNQVNLISWVRTQNNHCVQHIDRRPPRTFNVQVNINNQHNHINQTVINNHPVVIADTLERRVKTTANRSGKPESFKRLADDERHTIQKQVDPILTIARERREIEKATVKGLPGQLPANASTPVLTEQTSRKTKLTLPKVERKQIENAERTAAELKRQQDRQEREAQATARRLANKNETADQNPVLKKATDSARSRGTLPGGNQAGPDTRNSPPNTAGNDKAVLRKLENERRQAELKAAQQQKENQREADRLKAAQDRTLQRNNTLQDRNLRNNSGTVINNGTNNGNNNRDFEREQRKNMEQQQQQQRQMEMQQRRASEQASQRAAQQQREADLAARRQLESQERSMRQQREVQDRVQRQQQDQFREQQRQAQENSARQQREAAKQQRDMERQQQRDNRKKK